MNEAQKETLRFYTTNDYLLINGLLWGEEEERIDTFIRIINEDGRAVMKEAQEMGFAARWECSEEEGERLYRIYQKRFPVLDRRDVKQEILERARRDIENMMACMEPLQEEIVLYRNIKTRFVENVEEGCILNYLGFSSCSLQPHEAENAMYGSGGCTLAVIKVPAGTPAIRMDQMPEVQNEADEVILAPVKFLVTGVVNESHRIYMNVLR